MTFETTDAPLLIGLPALAEYLGTSTQMVRVLMREHGCPIKRLPGKQGPYIASPEQLKAWAPGFLDNLPTGH